MTTEATASPPPPNWDIPHREVGASVGMIVPFVLIFAVLYIVSLQTPPPTPWLGSVWLLPIAAVILSAVSVMRRRYAACRIEDDRLKVEQGRVIRGYRREEVRRIRQRRFFTGLAAVIDPQTGKEVDDALWTHKELSMEMTDGKTIAILLPPSGPQADLIQKWCTHPPRHIEIRAS